MKRHLAGIFGSVLAHNRISNTSIENATLDEGLTAIRNQQKRLVDKDTTSA